MILEATLFLKKTILAHVMLDALSNKYSLSGYGVNAFAWITNMDWSVKALIAAGTILIIVFNAVKSYREMKTAAINKRIAEHTLNELKKKNNQKI